MSNTSHHVLIGGPALEAWPRQRHGRIRPGKGGGGGDGGAARMEADRQARVRAAVDEINRIFNGFGAYQGINQATEYNPAQTYYDANGQAYRPTKQVRITNQGNQGNQGMYISGSGGDSVYAGGDRGYGRGFSINGAPASEQYKSVVDTDAIQNALSNGQLYTSAGRLKTSDRENLYNEQRQAITELNNQDVNRQFEQASRANRFGLARTGLSGGSADIDSAAELARRQNEGLIKSAAIGDGAGADLRAQDERTRQNLISMAQSGIDTGQAAQMALSGLEANAQSAAGARGAATVGSLFDDLSNAYLYSQQMRGIQQGMAPYQQNQRNGAGNIRSGGDAGRVY